MRNEYGIIHELLQFALGHNSARAMLLTGSRANPYASTDLLSDYDIELVVDDLKAFANDDWYKPFGNVISRVKIDHPDYCSRLVLFEDGTRIDFQVYNEAEFERKNNEKHARTTWDIGYLVLLDKDGLCSNMRKPVFTKFHTQKPSNNDFQELMNDFWWDTTYVAKSLWRNELFFAKYMMESVIRFSYFSQIIEWRIAFDHNWAINPDKYGRKFKTFLDVQEWKKLESTFAGSSIEENWKALFHTIDVFRHLARGLATDLGYPYPDLLDQRMTGYLQSVQHLKPDTDQLQQAKD